MAQEETNELADNVGAGGAPQPQYVERKWLLKDVARVESDFALPLLASELRHARRLLEKLAATSFGWTEFCLAGASLLIGAAFGVLPSDLKLEQKVIPILFYCVFPVLGTALLVAYLFLKGNENATTRETAARLLDSLPTVPPDKAIETTSEVRGQMKVDSPVFSSEALLPQLPDSAGKLFEADAGELDYSQMSDADLGYRFATALIKKEFEIAESIDKFQRGRREFNEAKFAARWEADFHYWKLVTGNGGSFEELKSWAVKSGLDPHVCNNIAAVYRWNREYELAAVWLCKGAANAQTPSEKVDFLSRAAERLHEGGDIDAALNLYEEISGIDAQDGEVTKAKTAGAAGFFEVNKQSDFEVAVLEYKLQQEPTNYDARFNLAYKHAERGRPSLAAYHYTLIPFENRTAMAWNNLGVTWRDLEVATAAAHAFQRAYDKGETLATSNLANMLIDAGFLDQAETLLARDIKLDHDIQLDQTVVRLHTAKQEDETTREKLLDQARKQAVFFQRLGAKAISPRPTLGSGAYSDGEYIVSLEVDRHRVRGSATQVVPANKLAIPLIGTTEDTVIHKFSITGTSAGAAISLELRREAGNRISSLLTAPIKFIGFFSDDTLECIDPSEAKNWDTKKFVLQSALDQVPSLEN